MSSSSLCIGYMRNICLYANTLSLFKSLSMAARVSPARVVDSVECSVICVARQLRGSSGRHGRDVLQMGGIHSVLGVVVNLGASLGHPRGVIRVDRALAVVVSIGAPALVAVLAPAGHGVIDG